MSWPEQVIDGLDSFEELSCSGSESISVTKTVTFLTTTSSCTPSLADAQAGQVKFITMVSDGGDATISVSNFLNGSTVTLASVGDWVALKFNGSQWELLDYSHELSAVVA